MSLWWVILYTGLHQLIDQILTGDYVFLYLRILFIVALVGVLARQGKMEAIRSIFLGRWLTRRKDWILAIGFILAVLVLRFAVSSVFHFKPSPATLNDFIMMAIVPSINEEIVFRGIVLGALIAHEPLRHARSVLLSSLIFVGCHHLGDPVPLGFVIGLSVQSLLYGVCFVVTRCLPLCMFLHFLWNSLSFLHD